MKKLLTLLMFIAMLTVSSALAEDTSFEFVPDADMLAHGSMQTIQVNSSTAFSMYVPDNWIRETDDAFWSYDAIARWSTESGLTLDCAMIAPAKADVYSADDLYTKLDESGFIPSAFTMNGMEDVIIAGTEDPLAPVCLGMVLPEGLFMMRTSAFESEEQADQAQSMLFSLCPAELEVLDVAVKLDELDMSVGHLETVSINDMPAIQFYVYDSYVLQEPDETWSQSGVFARWTNDVGMTLEARQIFPDTMHAGNLIRYFDMMANAGFEGSLFNFNGQDALAYYEAETKATQGLVTIVFDGSAIILTVSPIADDDQEAEALQMLWSLRPGM